ncbi:uncharacterized protein EV420DRAFT_1481368 [Desarmillaria tabescens]|uniref:Uncharacterized protein n=1 Tax=Armillaria tabescens TaxID=1929756 RepID=A0AA39N2X2_ARMTA|nr:uncharacterized protein EV420DRAFT_1481368 [Desarmillaria tabescens]KAK0455523.1 hypothetical protein EV420DRAFT_1481368 [Desarmillaria tabescens]
MDRFYNQEDAKETIESLIAERIAKDKLHLSRVMKDNGRINAASIRRDEDAGVWRIVRQNANDESTKETVFTITGAIFAMDLPPVMKETRSTRMLKEKARFLSQSVPLIGLGSKRFDEAVSAIKEIQVMGECEFRDGELEEWKPVTVKGYEMVELTNRYFRPKTSANEEEEIPIGADIDPAGVLRRIAQRKWIHMEDNVVRYYRGMIDDEGKKRYVTVKPQIFPVGNVVEAQCSMVFMRNNEGTARMKTILRALALVNCDHSSEERTNQIHPQKANADRRNAENMPAPAATRIKRKIGFEEDDDEDDYAATKKVNRVIDRDGDHGMANGM